ncbi:MAG: glutathione S-transferase [Phenylobacterium zucineum]|nr:MAG: glutathione S-transferase [Phenylobacterium zucineum]
MLRLHHAPMACSLASRFALIAAGLQHEVAIVHTTRGEQLTEAYRRINPRGKVPALETDQGVLTESTAILPFIADLAPEARLFPLAGTFARAEAQAWLSFLSSSLHTAMRAAMAPAPGCDTPEAMAAAVARVAGLLGEIDAHLAGRDSLTDTFGVCDLYLGVFLLWRAAPGLAGQLPVFPNLDRFQQGLFSRPALAAIVGEEMRLRMQA